MSIIFLLIPLSVVIAAGFLFAFIWAVRSGQYEDTCTPAMRLLIQDGVPPGRRGSSRPPAEIQDVASIIPLPQAPGNSHNGCGARGPGLEIGHFLGLALDPALSPAHPLRANENIHPSSLQLSVGSSAGRSSDGKISKLQPEARGPGNRQTGGPPREPHP